MPGRYQFSVPSNRGQADPWFRLGSVDVNTSLLIAGLCVVSFFVHAADPSLLRWIVMFPSDVRGGQVWRLASWPLANAPGLWVAISIALFWYFGSQIEALLGRVKFLWLLACIAILPGIVGALTDVPLGGIRAVELALFVVFALEYPNMPFFFGIPAWILAAVFVGIEVLELVSDRRSEELIVYLATIATALLVARSMGLLASQTWVPHVPLPFGSGRTRRPRVTKRVDRSGGKLASAAKNRPVVVDGPWAPPTPSAMQDQAEVDQILDKISQVGMDGLSSEEKKRLNDASKRLRQKRD